MALKLSEFELDSALEALLADGDALVGRVAVAVTATTFALVSAIHFSSTDVNVCDSDESLEDQ